MWGPDDYLHMRHSLNDADLFALVWAEIWRESRLAPATPRKCRPLPRHSHASLDDRYVRPVIRSRIPGGRTSYPPAPPPTFL